jgi:hypothetical protein
MDSKGLKYVWSPVGDAIRVSDTIFTYQNLVDRTFTHYISVAPIPPATFERSAEDTTTVRYCHFRYND